jgi:hypothetical protein
VNRATKSSSIRKSKDLQSLKEMQIPWKRSTWWYLPTIVAGVVVFILSCSLLLDVHALQVQELLKERVILEAPKVITDNKQTNDQTNESVQEPSRIPNKNLTCQFVFQRLSSVLVSAGMYLLFIVN